MYTGSWKGGKIGCWSVCFVLNSPSLSDLSHTSSSILVEKVVTLNSFGGSISSRASHLASSESISGHSSGVWAMAAIINHSCLGNCRRSFISDMQIIRAAQDMPSNTELFFPVPHPFRKRSRLYFDTKWAQELRIYLQMSSLPRCQGYRRKDIGDQSKTEGCLNNGLRNRQRRSHIWLFESQHQQNRSCTHFSGEDLFKTRLRCAQNWTLGSLSRTHLNVRYLRERRKINMVLA